jgi:hypothetical protein
MTHDSNKLRLILILCLAVILSLYLGIGAATAQAQTVLMVIGVAVLLGCVFMGRSIWLLIPFTTTLDLGLRIPGGPNCLMLAQLLVITFFFLLFLMRKLPIVLKITELEIWVFVMVGMVIQVYSRNPVGFSVFGGDTVGGKPYVLFAMTTVIALLISFLRVPERELRLILLLSILGALMKVCVSMIGKFVPVVAFYTGATHTRTDVVDYTNFNAVVDEGAATRDGTMSNIGRHLSLWISSYMSPLRACRHPVWGCLMAASLVAVMLGGFRNGVAALGMTYMISIAYRSGFAGTVIAAFGGATLIALLAFVNLVAPLPPNAQRTLTFLPGTWEQRYKDDAKGSTDWRVEIWKEALFSERWIQNTIMGDGLGFSAAELAAQLNFKSGSRYGVSGFDAHREAVLANGDYHSGPVSMIRTIGYVGLILFVVAQIRLIVHAHRQIMRCKDTDWYPLALFIGIPIIIAPVFFLFIFGDFKADMATLLMGIAMVRLLENNLPLPPYIPPSRSHYIPLIARKENSIA